MSSISVVVTAWNEEKRLKRCLSSVSWADEIIVVNCSSTDNTAVVARQFTKKIFHQPNYPMLNINKNFGFTKAGKDWILSLDADEEVTQELAREIKEKVKYAEVVGYWIPRKNIIFGKWMQHGLWWPDKQLRLFQRGKGKFPARHVHEYIAVEGPTAELVHPYIHYNYGSLSQYLDKMERIYTENEVQNLIASGFRVNWYDALRFPISDFVKVYLAQEGWRDGLHGLVLGILQSFYAFLVFAKVWEKQNFTAREISWEETKSEFRKQGHEIKYWLLTTSLKQTGNPVKRLWYKLVRRYAS